MEQWEREELIHNKVKEFYTEKLNFCSCGNPENTLSFIKKLLNLIDSKTKSYDNQDYNANRDKYYDNYQKDLIKTFEFEDKSTNNSYFSSSQNGVLQFVFYHLDEVGVLEHGGSIGGAWLSKYGKEILEYLNELSDEDIEDFFNI